MPYFPEGAEEEGAVISEFCGSVRRWGTVSQTRSSEPAIATLTMYQVYCMLHPGIVYRADIGRRIMSTDSQILKHHKFTAVQSHLKL